MRKGTIKAAVLAAVFIGAVLIFGRFMNDTNEDLTTEMKEATLPVITMYQGDQELNELHGYVTEMVSRIYARYHYAGGGRPEASDCDTDESDGGRHDFL